MDNHKYAMMMASLSLEDDLIHIAKALRDMVADDAAISDAQARNILMAAAELLEQRYHKETTVTQ